MYSIRSIGQGTSDVSVRSVGQYGSTQKTLEDINSSKEYADASKQWAISEELVTDDTTSDYSSKQWAIADVDLIDVITGDIDKSAKAWSEAASLHATLADIDAEAADVSAKAAKQSATEAKDSASVSEQSASEALQSASEADLSRQEAETLVESIDTTNMVYGGSYFDPQEDYPLPIQNNTSQLWCSDAQYEEWQVGDMLSYVPDTTDPETTLGQYYRVGSVTKGYDLPSQLTVGTGGDYLTIKEAVAYIEESYSETSVEILLLTGFVIQEQLLIEGSDLKHVTISSEDDVVSIDHNSIDQTFTTGVGDFTPVFGGKDTSSLPVINFLGSYSGGDKDGVAVTSGSLATLTPNSGIMNCKAGISVSHGSEIICYTSDTDQQGVVFTGCSEGLAVSYLSKAGLPYSDFTGSSVTATSSSIIDVPSSIAGSFSVHQGSVINMTDGDGEINQASNVTTADGTIFGEGIVTFFYSLPTDSDPTNVDCNARLTQGYNFVPNKGIYTYEPITDMSYMFNNCTTFNQDISSWNVSTVTDMSGMFNCCETFNQDIGKWDVSHVTNMYMMFTCCYSFDQDISNWDVSKVTDMSWMLNAASVFNQDISVWDVSNVITMENMFHSIEAFNQDLSAWDVSSVTNMIGMFNNTDNFNSNITTWDVSNVESMNGMFDGASAFNQDISQWDVSKVHDMGYMFYRATVFNQDIGNWDTSSCDTMRYMFYNATAFDQDLSGWNVELIMYEPSGFGNSGLDPVWGTDGTGPYKAYFYPLAAENDPTNYSCPAKSTVGYEFIANEGIWSDEPITDMSMMFYNCTTFNEDISGWDVSEVTSMSNMFQYASVFNQDLSNWDVSNVTNMNSLFHSASVFNQDISQWDVSKVENMFALFQQAVTFNQDISNWDTSAVTNMGNMFCITESFAQDLSTWDVLLIPNEPSNFSVNTGEMVNPVWGTDGTGPYKAYFYPTGDLTEDPTYATCNARSTSGYEFVSGEGIWCDEPITDMSVMFKGTVFNEDISSWDTSKVTSMGSMFRDTAFNQNISNWNIGQVTNISYMFSSSSFNQDISQWDTSKVTNMSHLFYYDSSFNQDLSAWDTSSVTDMSATFRGTIFNNDISKWDTSSVVNMEYMFSSSNFDQDISQWDTSNATNMKYMFYGSNTFNQDLSSWNVLKILSKPTSFNTSSSLTDENCPVWGTDGTGPYKDYFYSLETETDPTRSDCAARSTAGYEFVSGEGIWCDEPITDMSKMFYFEASFNEDISSWDTSAVVNMDSMFYYADAFNKDISSWDVSNIGNMANMFSFAGSFNQDISGWDTGSCSNMNNMFYNAVAFSQDLSSWNVLLIPSIPSNFDANSGEMVNPVWGSNGGVFPISKDYFYKLETETDPTYSACAARKTAGYEFEPNVGIWCDEPITDMSFMFKEETSFNTDISSWDVSKVTDMSYMFYFTNTFNQDITSWNTTSVTNMSAMFYQASAFSQNLSEWCVTLVPTRPASFSDNAGNMIEPIWGTDGT